MTPKISIVVPSLNQGVYLADALDSVLRQSYPDVELILIDGGSDDETLNVIDRYSGRLSFVSIEPDGGQSAALNKGFSHATGNLLTWLNSDDVLLPRALHRASEAQTSNESVGWYAGGCFWIDAASRVLTCALGEPLIPILPVLGHLHVYAPGSFFSPELYAESGGFDESLHYVMDTDLWWRFWRNGHRYVNIPHYLWGFRIHKQSKTSKHLAPEIRGDQRQLAPNEKYVRERLMLGNRYPATVTGWRSSLGQNISRIIRLSTLSYPRSYIDRLRFAGQHWTECI